MHSPVKMRAEIRWQDQVWAGKNFIGAESVVGWRAADTIPEMKIPIL